MRPSNKRSRSKQNRPRTLGNIVNRVFDSSGPEGKVRGTPQQIIDKYQVLARDAQLSGDRVAAENFSQHAEHYTRMLNEAQAELAREADQRREHQQGQPQNQNGGQNQPRRDDRDAETEVETRSEPRGEQRQDQRPDQRGEQRDWKDRRNARRDDRRNRREPGDPRDENPADAAQDDGPMLVETPEARREAAPAPVAETAAADAPATAVSDADTAAPEGDARPKPRRNRPRKPKAEDAPADSADAAE